jgi:hypothetical protein
MKTNPKQGIKPKLKQFEELLNKHGIKVKDGKVPVKDLLKFEDILSDAVPIDGGEFIIGIHDWNLQEKVWRFPLDKRQELISKIRKIRGKDQSMSSIWDWFLTHAKRTRGMEDLDLYLDFNDPKSSLDDYED